MWNATDHVFFCFVINSYFKNPVTDFICSKCIKCASMMSGMGIVIHIVVHKTVLEINLMIKYPNAICQYIWKQNCHVHDKIMYA